MLWKLSGDSLSSNRWSTKRSKIKTDVDELAVQLLDIESKRSIANSFSFKQDQEFDSNFHNTFPYELTSDQIRCLEDVYKDLSLIKPMNRVICGDTGFGKTEIAMRAANLVTYNNKQVTFVCYLLNCILPISCCIAYITFNWFFNFWESCF